MDRPSTLQNVLEIMSSKRNFVSKNQVEIRVTDVKSGFGGLYGNLFAKPNT